MTGVVTKFLYNRNSSLVKTIDPVGKFKTIVVDSRERPVQTLDGNNAIIAQTTFNNNDLPTAYSIVSPVTGLMAVVRTMNRNARNEVTSEVDNFGNTYSYLYDPNGNRNQTTNPAGTIATAVFDTMDQSTSQTVDSTGLNVVTSRTFDVNGNLTAFTLFNPATGANDAVYQFKYDRANRRIGMHYPLDATGVYSETWTYDGLGRLGTHTDRCGMITTYAYDNLGRILSESYGSPFNKTITRTYDGASNVLSISDGTITITYTYDVLNRQLSASWTVSGAPYKSISNQYDDAGNRTTMTDPESVAFTYGYDVNNRPTTITRAGVAAQGVGQGAKRREAGRGTFRRDATGRRISGVTTE